MSDETIAKRIHDAYSTYVRLRWDLFEAVEKIVGEDRVEDTHVESDSQHDNSIEIVLSDGVTLTDAQRAEILKLGFSRIWSDVHSRRDADLARLRAHIKRLEAVLRWTHESYCTAAWADRGLHAPECLLFEIADAAALSRPPEGGGAS